MHGKHPVNKDVMRKSVSCLKVYTLDGAALLRYITPIERLQFMRFLLILEFLLVNDLCQSRLNSLQYETTMLDAEDGCKCGFENGLI